MSWLAAPRICIVSALKVWKSPGERRVSWREVMVISWRLMYVRIWWSLSFVKVLIFSVSRDMLEVVGLLVLEQGGVKSVG